VSQKQIFTRNFGLNRRNQCPNNFRLARICFKWGCDRPPVAYGYGYGFWNWYVLL